MRVLNVNPNSPLFGHVRPGHRLKSINGQKVLDCLDYQYRVTDERIRLTFADNRGREQSFDIEDCTTDGLGLTLDDDKVRRCNNDCIFCFVDQQPYGMRPGLYVKDEDYRLSFTHGNFITLSNTSETNLKRIVEQRLSPLYVSVHTTDDKLRRRMFRNPKVPAILPRLQYLTSNGITIHSQVVLCPGINDGPRLEQTIDDLAALYPGVASLAIVPVGLTKYRDDLTTLRQYTAQEAGEIVAFLHKRQKDFHRKIGSRFVWPSDEFYVAANRPFPSRHEYEDMPQFENGVGMVREFISVFNRRRSHLKSIRSKKRVMMLTGYSAQSFLTEHVVPYINKELGLNLTFESVPNRFWGDSVTVTGLLTGQDLLRHARRKEDQYDLLVLPPNCLNQDDLFLDNLTLSQFKQTLEMPVLVGQYNLADTIREAYS